MTSPVDHGVGNQNRIIDTDGERDGVARPYILDDPLWAVGPIDTEIELSTERSIRNIVDAYLVEYDTNILQYTGEQIVDHGTFGRHVLASPLDCPCLSTGDGNRDDYVADIENDRWRPDSL